MSWVLLSLRKSELKMVHSQYVAEDLQISRQQRKDARHYQYEQMIVRNDQRSQIASLYAGYKTTRDQQNGVVKQKRDSLKLENQTISALDSDICDYDAEIRAIELQQRLAEAGTRKQEPREDNAKPEDLTPSQMNADELETRLAQLNTAKEQAEKQRNQAVTNKEALNNDIADAQTAINTAKEDYEKDAGDVKDLAEDDLETIENEANDVDSMHEEEKVQIETQMEAVSQELQAVSDAISQQIQNECIKLS